MKTYIYFIQCPHGPIKIGLGKSPFHRMSQLQTAWYAELEMCGFFEGDYYIENELHREFSDLRMEGEWFEYHERLLDRLESCVRQYGGIFLGDPSDDTERRASFSVDLKVAA